MTNEDKPHHNPIDDILSDETRRHMKRARAEMRRSVESMFPPGFVEHRRAARKEMLLAVRSLLDSAIQHMDPPETETKV